MMNDMMFSIQIDILLVTEKKGISLFNHHHHHITFMNFMISKSINILKINTIETSLCVFFSV